MKIFIISLSNSTDRQDFMKQQLENNNISYGFFNAVDGRKLSLEETEILYDIKKAKKYRELTPGEIGCSLSHKAIYKKIIDENIERAIILEDDIIIRPDFKTIVSYFENLPLKGYVIKLERAYGGNKNEDNKKITRFTIWHNININNDYYIGQPLSPPYLTWGYYIDIIAAKSLYKSMPKVYHVADAWGYHKKYIKLRMLNIPVISNNEIFDSIIGEQGKILRTNKKIFLQFKKIFNYFKLIFY